MRQWHPIFVRLLRPAVETHYEVQTTVPVGDAPREADIVLLRRTSAGTPLFQGIWKHLTTWNVLEFKGPTVSLRLRDLDALVELGLGIDRRLNEDRRRHRLRRLSPREVSFWLLANHLGQRFLRDARERFGLLERADDGIWRCELLGRMVFLVSSVNLPIEEDSLPLHIISKEPPETELATARFVAEHPRLWERYGPWLAYLHEESWREVRQMARATGRVPKFSLNPLVEAMKEDESLEKELINFIVKEVDLTKVVANLSKAQREKLKRQLESTS